MDAEGYAIEDSVWTFDSGVGSHFNHNDPHVNPFKDPALHAYMEGWKLGLKALAIYRDGSKQSQPLATTKEGDRNKKGGIAERAKEEVKILIVKKTMLRLFGCNVNKKLKEYRNGWRI